jgi:DNA-binding transcriptional LysR family regulator
MRLPPFLTLTALEAAARHRSYSRAARELHVTHGAVSQQIRKLEDELGDQLFVRQGNAMAPTATGQRLAAQVTEALATLHAGVDERPAGGERSAGDQQQRRLRQRAGWSPAWRGLARETDEPDLIVRAEDRVADLTTDGVDIALRFGLGVWPGVEVGHPDDRADLPGLQPRLSGAPSDPASRATCWTRRCCATWACPGAIWLARHGRALRRSKALATTGVARARKAGMNLGRARDALPRLEQG